jgi:medium-chain acyl-[acyl-carrier-protein] hydrolase
MIHKIKLFTFPYAGGHSNLFRPWQKHLNEIIELWSVELPGRGTRLPEPLPDSIEEIVHDLVSLFSNNKADYALFGHSMGAIIIYELLLVLNKYKLKMPLHVFFSGGKAPHIRSKDQKKYHLLNNQQFIEEIIQLGGTPDDIFNEPELAEFFLPVLKNDFIICDNYVPDIIDKKFDIDFSILAGTEECYEEADLSTYGSYTTGETTVKYFKGGHFFIKESETEVIDFINKTLLKYIYEWNI